MLGVMVLRNPKVLPGLRRDNKYMFIFKQLALRSLVLIANVIVKPVLKKIYRLRARKFGPLLSKQMYWHRHISLDCVVIKGISAALCRGRLYTKLIEVVALKPLHTQR